MVDWQETNRYNSSLNLLERSSSNRHGLFKSMPKVMDFDPEIRYVGICNHTGENVYGGLRNGIKTLLSREETKQANLQALATWGLYLPLESKVGRGKYIMVEFEKIKRITVPLDKDHLLVVTTEVDIDHEHNKINSEFQNL